MLSYLFQLQVFDSNKDGKLQLSEMAKYVWRVLIQSAAENSLLYSSQIAAGEGKLSDETSF